MSKIIQFIIALGLILFIVQCKTKEEGAPEISISVLSSTIEEGDTLVFQNNSKNVSTSSWVCEKLKFTSTSFAPSIVIADSGTYDFTYTGANGDGVSKSQMMTITVLPDTAYRLSNNTKKIWIIKSIIYNGTEMVNTDCMKDDEFTVYKGTTDTCTITHGKDTCAPGTYIFDLPATSGWRWNTKTSKFEFALYAFGSPVNLSFKPEICTKAEFKGTDAINNVKITLNAKL